MRMQDRYEHFRLACLAFTEAGEALTTRIRAEFAGPVDCFTKANYKPQLARIFAEYDGIVFCAATGIAVRLSAPFLSDKRCDPAVVVIDDLRRYAISLISGHLGGANELTRELARLLGCQPIITTASDGRDIEALDLFARAHDLYVENWEEMKALTALMVAGRPIQFCSDLPLPLRYAHLTDDSPAGRVYVTAQVRVPRDLPTCLLHPKTLYVGIGCRKGVSQAALEIALQRVFERYNLSLRSIAQFATIQHKQHEPGLRALSHSLALPLTIFSAEAIRGVQNRFAASAFVESILGVTAVCEPCAYLAACAERDPAQVRLRVPKQAQDGITIAVAQIT